MRIIFMGSPNFAIPTLKALINAQHEIVACFTQPARPKDRGKKLLITPVEAIAKTYNIPVYTPKSLNNDLNYNLVKKLEADFIIVVAYGLILPQNILDLAKYAALNLHPSALPQFRGAAPLQRSIMSGATTTNICVIKMLAALDAGPIYKAVSLNMAKLNYGELHDESAKLGAKLMVEVIENFTDLQPVAQEQHNITYAHKIAKAEMQINFQQKGQQIINLIRALSPAPGAYFLYKNERYKILAANFKLCNHQEPTGSLTENFSLYCQDGLILPLIIQKSGKKPQKITEFLHGNKI
jgi:methionyl-tRNA formyltransferase